MKTTVINNLKAITLAVILTLGSSYAIGAWSEPGSGCTPPNCNADAPINASTTAQTKLGPLTLMHLFTPDFTLTKSDGSVTGIASSSILMAKGPNTGNVTWGSTIYLVEDFGDAIRCPYDGTFYDPGGSAGAGFDFTFKCINGIVKFFSTDNRNFTVAEGATPRIRGEGNTGQFYSAYDAGSTLMSFTVDGSGYMTTACRNTGAACPTGTATNIYCNWAGDFTTMNGTSFYCNSNKLYSISAPNQTKIQATDPPKVKKYNIVSGL